MSSPEKQTVNCMVVSNYDGCGGRLALHEINNVLLEFARLLLLEREHVQWGCTAMSARADTVRDDGFVRRAEEGQGLTDKREGAEGRDSKQPEDANIGVGHITIEPFLITADPDALQTRTSVLDERKTRTPKEEPPAIPGQRTHPDTTQSRSTSGKGRCTYILSYGPLQLGVKMASAGLITCRGLPSRRSRASAS